MIEKPKPKRGDFGVVFDGGSKEPTGIVIYLSPTLTVCVRLDGTLHPKGPYTDRRAMFFPTDSQNVLAQIARFGASAYQPPAAPQTYGETLEPCV